MSDRLTEIRGRQEDAGGWVGLHDSECRVADEVQTAIWEDVPWLVSEVERLREALRQYADEDNWSTHDLNVALCVWLGPERGHYGPSIAQAALRRPEGEESR